MKYIFKKLHLWLSLPVGIVIFVTCLSGAALVYQKDVLELLHPQRYFVEYDGAGAAMPLAELVPLAGGMINDNSVTAVTVSSDPRRAYSMTLKEGFRVSAFVNQYDGQITGYYRTQESGFFTIMRLHRWLMDGTRTWGKYVVGISTLLFIIILIAGLIIQPTSLLKRRTYRFRKGRALLYGLHNVLGIYAFLVLIVGAATGLMWSFEWYRNGVFKIFGTEAPARGGHGGGGGRGERAEPSAVDYAVWDSVVRELSSTNPDFSTIQVQDGRATVKLPSHPTSRASDTYNFDRTTGQITDVTLYKDSAKSAKVWGWVYSLHTGDRWGWWSKLLVFVAAIIGASLPVTGYWLYFRKLGKRRKSHPKQIIT